MSCCVIEELSDGLICLLRMFGSRFGFLVGDGVECCEHGALYNPNILQQCSNFSLEFCSLVLVMSRGGVVIWRLLYYVTVLRSSPFMRTIQLVNGGRVLKFMEGFINLAWNLYVYMFPLLTPLYGE